MTVQFPTAAADVVGVYDANFRQLFAAARAMKASVKTEAKVFTHPLEDGAPVSDHKIYSPAEIELWTIIDAEDYKAVYQQIKSAFRSNALLIVQTRADVFKNMTIAAMPHDEDPEMFDVLPVVINLVEVQLVRAQFQALPPAAVAKPANQSTVKRGEQQPTEGGSKGSVAYRILYGK